MAEELTFYDLKAKKKFSTGNYTVAKKNGRRFAKTTAPSGCAAYRILGKA